MTTGGSEEAMDVEHVAVYGESKQGHTWRQKKLLRSFYSKRVKRDRQSSSESAMFIQT